MAKGSTVEVVIDPPRLFKAEVRSGADLEPGDPLAVDDSGRVVHAESDEAESEVVAYYKRGSDPGMAEVWPWL